MKPETKLPVRGGMKVRAYDVFVRCLEEGVNCGWNRAHKHTDEPSVEAIKEAIENAVMNSVTEYFDFGDEEAER